MSPNPLPTDRDRAGRRYAALVVLTTVAVVALGCSGTDDEAAGPTTSTPTVAATTDGDIPYVAIDATVFEQQVVVDGWLDRPGGPDEAAVTGHAWELWGAINADSGFVLEGTPLTVWETWYTDAEVFQDAPEVDDPDARDLGLPAQVTHAGTGALTNEAAALSFNRFNRQMADHLLANRSFDSGTLDALRSDLDLAALPVAERTVADFPNTAVMVKPVFWIVPGDEPSMMPYWAGEGPDVASDQANPMWKTWKQCVLVDPTGSATADEDRDCNVGQPGESPAPAGSYPVKRIGTDPATSDLYAFRLTQDEVDGLGQFTMILDDTNVDKQLDEVQAGDYALLVAMHVSTREIPNWTWQTFWWTPDPTTIPSTPPNATAAPRDVPAPFDQFHSCTAYAMVDPAGQPIVCFNPYLETDLTGLLSVDRSVTDAVGKDSNCMSCHFTAQYTGNSSQIDYLVNGQIDAGDPAWFADGVRTQFSWATTFRAHEPPFRVPRPTGEAPPPTTGPPGTSP